MPSIERDLSLAILIFLWHIDMDRLENMRLSFDTYARAIFGRRAFLLDHDQMKPRLLNIALEK